MSNPLFDAREQLEQLREQAHQSAREANDFAAQVERQDYTGHSGRREVSVRVGSDGLIREITFSPAAPTIPAASLGRAVLEAHDRALLTLRNTVEAMAQDAFPSTPDLARVTVAQYHQSIPDRVDLLEDDENGAHRR